MSKFVGISVLDNRDGKWLWQLHLTKGPHQRWMHGIAETYADAETAAATAKARFESEKAGALGVGPSTGRASRI